MLGMGVYFCISIHAPLAGCDRIPIRGLSCPQAFQSTHPLRGATRERIRLYRVFGISIHAPLAGCDWNMCQTSTQNKGFQSTHPLRGATRYAACLNDPLDISIHAPLAGCDLCRFLADHETVFQSTHPLRGATLPERVRAGKRYISIHAPLAGCDCGSRTSCGSWSHFNPRTPRGVRLRQRRRSDRAGHISIHAPLTGCDDMQQAVTDTKLEISIHAPLTGCDDRGSCNSGSRRYFNPRTPYGVRPVVCPRRELVSLFQSTHPSRGATAKIHKFLCVLL